MQGPRGLEGKSEIEERDSCENHSEDLFHPDHPDSGAGQTREESGEGPQNEIGESESERHDEKDQKTEKRVALRPDKGKQGNNGRPDAGSCKYPHYQS